MVNTAIMAPIMAFWAFLGAGSALPLGLIPEEIDPVMMQAAPAECVIYTTWAGLDVPNPDSENRFEALLGEPEVKEFYQTLLTVARDAIDKQAEREGGSEAKAMVEQITPIVEMLLSEPAVIFVEELQFDPRTGPSGKMGAVFSLGDKTAKVKALVEMFFPALPEEMRRTIEQGGRTYRYIRLGPDQILMFTFEGDYLIAGIGDGVVPAIIARITDPNATIAPWLTAAQEKLFPERFSSIMYINVKKIRELLMPMAPPQVASLLNASGLDSITELTTVNGLDGPDVVSRSFIGLDGPPRGFLGLTDAPSLTVEDLAPVPADTTYAIVKQVDPAETFKVTMQVLGRLGPEATVIISQVFGYAENTLGVNLMDDLLDPLGNKWYIYSSPGEGGLGLVPTLVISVDDYDKLAVTEQKLLEAAKKSLEMVQQMQEAEIEQLRQQAAQEGTYFHAEVETPPVEIKHFEFEGETIYYIDIAAPRYGPPMPITPSWCLTKKGLIVALMPQFVKAHLRRGDDAKSLGDNPEVAARLADESSTAASLGYLDMTRLVDALYPIAVYGWQMTSSAIELEGETRLSPALLPSMASIRPHMGPMIMTYGSIEGGLLMQTRGPIPPQMMSGGLAVPVALLLPAIQSARASAKRVASMNNMKQLMLALIMYEMDHGKLPPAYTVDDDGKPLLSWRVAILPYLDSQGIYDRFKLDEPWDSPHNKQLLYQMPAIFSSPRAEQNRIEGLTTYQTPSGKGVGLPTPDKKMGMGELRDGCSQTIAIVETYPHLAVPWTKPADFKVDKDYPSSGLLLDHNMNFLAAFFDGSIRSISDYTDEDALYEMFTRGDKVEEKEDADGETDNASPEEDTNATLRPIRVIEKGGRRGIIEIAKPAEDMDELEVIELQK